MAGFVHLHVHSQYSILDGACRISELVAKAAADGMPAVAVTDHGNLFGIKEFYEAAKGYGLKPIIGCETYVARRRLSDRTDVSDRKGDHLILLAKNQTGYRNLMKLISTAWIEGFYYKPRIDKELLRAHSEGLIASSACLAGEIPRAIQSGDMPRAEKAILGYKEIFGDDFYLELMRHKVTDHTRDEEVYRRQTIVNNALVELSKNLGVKLLATNDVHFLNENDAEAHDRLLCINTGKVMTDTDRLRYTGQEWFKTSDEMGTVFGDIPEALENTLEVAGKVEVFDLNREPIMPDFPIPEGYKDADEYLRYLTYEGAAVRYSEITPEIRERIDFELDVIHNMGYPSYFLIVQDFLHAARNMGVSVGPGRGSAAGSVVAYCTRITDVDPLKYDLLFERFLNPDRVSLPDIDIDFDEDGRDRVLQWVVEKYGRDKVAQVITFGTMGAKGAIRDVARVHQMPLDEVGKLTKLIPTRPGITLKQAYEEVPELKALRHSSNKQLVETLKFAEFLEGSIRQTGLHACGVIIGRDSLVDHVPLSTSKESSLLVTQFDGDHIEKVGMLKMDFLGLKTLAIINDALRNIRISKGEEVDIENAPLDDPLTYQLFSQGRTTGIFQFESDGMKKYLRELKPNQIGDLIAMNALYRPGPMEYIPSFINRKHGKERISYDIPVMEKYLQDTYGITVYQEQVMLLSQQLAGFTKGQADSLRKAMGKKIERMMEDLKPKFIEGCKKNGHDEKTVEKIWKDWEAFANYAFNKSHSTCYAYVAYRMAYLKAHYPAEFMAAVLSRNITDMKEITKFMDECKRMQIALLGPDVNESDQNFMVNKKGEIRFGMAGIRNVGESAVKSIIEERTANGPFEDIFDLTRRVTSHTVNKRCLEALAQAGAFDCFAGSHRAQYFFKERDDDTSFLEKVMKQAADYNQRKNSSQHSLFGESEEVAFKPPALPVCPPLSRVEQLRIEKEVTGFYISGHPLDDFRVEFANFCTVNIESLKSDLKRYRNLDISFAGIVTNAQHKTGKNGKAFGSFTVEDYLDSVNLFLYSEEYLKYKHLIADGMYVFIRARVEGRFDDPNQLVIRISTMVLLSEVMEKFTKSLAITLPLGELNPTRITGLLDLAKKHKGKAALRIRVEDPDDHTSVDLPSKKYRVNPREMITALASVPDLEVRLLQD
jgi:DNA polymerase III subunit alpha